MKICLVGYLGTGGADRQIIMLANALANRNHDVYLIALAVNRKNYEISKDIKLINLLDDEKRSFINVVSRYANLKKTLKKIRPNVTISYWLQPVYMMSFMSKRITGKVIYSERGDPGDSEYTGILRYARNYSFSKSVDGFVFQTKSAQSYFNNEIQRKSIVIANSVNVPNDKFLSPSTNREKRIVNVGRLHEQKNQKLLIDAFSLISSTYPEYSLEIYGVGPLKNELEMYIRNKQLDERIRLMGRRIDIFDCIYNSALFVLSSDFEGMPNALMEAMAIGIPCITTDYKPGGARELIKDGINGYIVPRDNQMELANAIRNILDSPDLGQSFARKGLEIRQSNSSERIFDMWEEFIVSINNR